MMVVIEREKMVGPRSSYSFLPDLMPNILPKDMPDLALGGTSGGDWAVEPVGLEGRAVPWKDDSERVKPEDPAFESYDCECTIAGGGLAGRSEMDSSGVAPLSPPESLSLRTGGGGRLKMSPWGYVTGPMSAGAA